jgi:putative phosphoesterase
MRIAIVSDTHGDVAAWRRAKEVLGGADLVIHAGDVLYHGPRNPLKPGYNPPELAEELNNLSCPLLVARGNCDSPVDEEVLKAPMHFPLLFVQYEGLRIVAHHGHEYPLEGLVELCRRWKVTLCISGHTHLPVLEKREGIIVLNPGSPSLPKGTRPRSTVGLVASGKVQIVDIDSGEIVAEQVLA